MQNQNESVKNHEEIKETLGLAEGSRLAEELLANANAKIIQNLDASSEELSLHQAHLARLTKVYPDLTMHDIAPILKLTGKYAGAYLKTISVVEESSSYHPPFSFWLKVAELEQFSPSTLATIKSGLDNNFGLDFSKPDMQEKFLNYVKQSQEYFGATPTEDMYTLYDGQVLRTKWI